MLRTGIRKLDFERFTSMRRPSSGVSRCDPAKEEYHYLDGHCVRLASKINSDGSPSPSTLEVRVDGRVAGTIRRVNRQKWASHVGLKTYPPMCKLAAMKRVAREYLLLHQFAARQQAGFGFQSADGEEKDTN